MSIRLGDHKVDLRKYFKSDLDYFCWLHHLNKEKVLKDLADEEASKNKPPITLEDVFTELES